MNVNNVRNLLQSFDFRRLFVEELGWSQPATGAAETVEHGGAAYACRHIAELSGVVVMEVVAAEGAIPAAKERAAVHRELAARYHENLLVFVDAARTQSLWYWVKREEGRKFPREHLYVKGQPGDLFISKLSGIVFDISRFDAAGDISLVEVADSLKSALDIERVTKRFYEEFKTKRLGFTELIEGIADDRERRWYASVMLNRLMFIYFLQSKGFVDNGRMRYLQEHLEASSGRFGPDGYYEHLLKPLFFEGFAKPEGERSEEARKLLGGIVYLNGGLFLEHAIEERNPAIHIPDRAFANLYALFGRYSWNLNDTPGGSDDEINPDVLGYIFEKYINQKAFGAYYTRPEITEYLCEHTIHQLVLDRINPGVDVPGLPTARRFDSLADLLLNLDAPLCRRLLFDVLPSLNLLDPACGSGAFLVAAMKTLINIYSAVTGRIDYLNDSYLTTWLQKTRAEHKSLNYYIKRAIITHNLFGVDIMEEACEIAKLRLFLALVSSARSADQLEPLPNIDFNILAGNSLVGLLHVDDVEFNRRDKTGSLFSRSYREVLEEKNRLVKTYRETATFHRDLQAMRDQIAEKKAEAKETLDEILLEEFKGLGVKFEQAAWDAVKGEQGKPVKRPVTLADIRALEPFHWGYEFDEVLNGRGGFDAIITNPPWEVWQTDEKEFHSDYLPLMQKNKMRIEDWREQRAPLMIQPMINAAWIKYASRFPHIAAYLKAAAQYRNQISYVNGRNVGSKINLYTYFTEQCYNLLRTGGGCGIVIPSGIYTDLGTKQLRELLFSNTEITGLFGFENRRLVFENVDSRFKFVVLTFRKAGTTLTFPAAFMRHDVSELESFPRKGALTISTPLVRRLSPESLSIMEFRSEMDVLVAEKATRFPTLGETVQGAWQLILSQEVNMTSDSHLFKAAAAPGLVPLIQGGMFHQFNHAFAPAKYWLDPADSRREVLGRQEDTGQRLAYQDYRLVHRRIARNTDNRTLIAAILPSNRFCADTAQAARTLLQYDVTLFVTALFNSFVLDAELRKRVTTHCDMHFMYALRLPRLSATDPAFRPIVERAARLICTTPEFDDLAREVGLTGHENGATAPAERARLRAELDALVARLYGLTEAEFAHILASFPLVAESVKADALAAFLALEPAEPLAPVGGQLV